MKLILGTAIVAFLVLGSSAGAASADTGAHPYTIIPDRNVFGLNKRPQQIDQAPTNPPPPKLTLLGIANVFGTRKAVLRPGEPGKPTQAAKPGEDSTLVLQEGDAAQGIRILSIDEKAGIVKVDNNGQEAALNFEVNGLKQPTGPAAPTGAPAAGVPGAPAVPGVPGAIPPPAFGVPRPGVPAGTVPARGVTPGFPAATSGTLGSQPLTPTSTDAMSGTASLPSRNMRTGQERVLTKDEQEVMIEVNRERYRALGVTPPPLPPTSLSQQLKLEAEAGSGNVAPILPRIPGR